MAALAAAAGPLAAKLAQGGSVIKYKSPLNVLKDTNYDYSCCLARSYEYNHLMADPPPGLGEARGALLVHGHDLAVGGRAIQAPLSLFCMRNHESRISTERAQRYLRS